MYIVYTVVQMKHYQAVIEENLSAIQEMVKIYNFRAAFEIVSDLTKICTLFDDEDGILIMEVLEGIFSQVGPIFENYELSEDLKKEIASITVGELNKIMDNYKSKNQINIYKNLRYIRSISTKLQIDQVRTGTQLTQQDRIKLPEVMNNLLLR